MKSLPVGTRVREDESELTGTVVGYTRSSHNTTPAQDVVIVFLDEKWHEEVGAPAVVMDAIDPEDKEQLLVTVLEEK